MAWHQLSWELRWDRMGTTLHFQILLARRTAAKPNATREMSNFAKVLLTIRTPFLSFQMFYLNDLPLLFYFTLTTLKFLGTEASFIKFLKTMHSFFWKGDGLKHTPFVSIWVSLVCLCKWGVESGSSSWTLKITLTPSVKWHELSRNKKKLVEENSWVDKFWAKIHRGPRDIWWVMK